MQSKKNNVQIGVFYDGNFLLHTSNYYNYIHSQKRRLSIAGLHKFIRQTVADCEGVDYGWCHISDAHYFRGRLNALEASQRGNQLYNDRVFDDILMADGIQTHYLPLCNLFGRKEERGIDVWLALEAFEISIVKKLDTVVLVASDTDYVPLVRKLTGLGVRVYLMCWEFEYTNEEGNKVVTKTSHELLNVASVPLPMHNLIEAGLKKKDPIVSNIFVSESTRSAPTISAVASSTTIETSEVLSLKNGYGFIKYPNNNLFFHYQNVIGDFTLIKVGDIVEFTLDKNTEGQDIAKNVKRISAAEETDDMDEFYEWDPEAVLADTKKK